MVNDKIAHGTIYTLTDSQHLRFKTKDWDGATNEEIIQVLIDRIFKLNDKVPYIENTQALSYLVAANNKLVERELRIQNERN